MNDLPKIVFSHSLHTVSWENTRLIRDNIKEEVRRLKQLSCKKILMLACYDLTLTFMDLNPIEKTKHSLQE
jgi:dihydrofolate reductase